MWRPLHRERHARVASIGVTFSPPSNCCLLFNLKTVQFFVSLILVWCRKTFTRRARIKDKKNEKRSGVVVWQKNFFCCVWRWPGFESQPLKVGWFVAANLAAAPAHRRCCCCCWLIRWCWLSMPDQSQSWPWIAIRRQSLASRHKTSFWDASVPHEKLQAWALETHDVCSTNVGIALAYGPMKFQVVLDFVDFCPNLLWLLFHCKGRKPFLAFPECLFGVRDHQWNLFDQIQKSLSMVFLTKVCFVVFKVSFQSCQSNLKIQSVNQDWVNVNRVVENSRHVSLFAFKTQLPCRAVERVGPGFESPPRINCSSSLSSLTSSWRIVFPLISRHLVETFVGHYKRTQPLSEKGVNEGWRIISWFYYCYDVRTLGSNWSHLQLFLLTGPLDWSISWVKRLRKIVTSEL